MCIDYPLAYGETDVHSFAVCGLPSCFADASYLMFAGGVHSSFEDGSCVGAYPFCSQTILETGALRAELVGAIELGDALALAEALEESRSPVGYGIHDGVIRIFGCEGVVATIEVPEALRTPLMERYRSAAKVNEFE